MSEIIKRTFKCTGCGESRPCFLTTNQSNDEIAFYDPAEYLKCVLDETNNTSPNWEEVQANETDKSTDPVLHKNIASNCADIESPYFDKNGKQIEEFAVIKIFHFKGVNDQGRGRKNYYMCVSQKGMVKSGGLPCIYLMIVVIIFTYVQSQILK